MKYEELINDLRHYSNVSITAAVGGLTSDAADAIEALQAELPKRGEWIRIDKHTIQCPLCRRYLDLRGVNAGRGDANYCPNCGAKMEVSE